jgi:epoxyqueuosine reductase
MDSREAIRQAAREAELDLLGFARVDDLAEIPDLEFYGEWLERGFAGEMNYLKGNRAERRADPRQVLPGACSVICVALNYNTSAPRSTECPDPSRAWISRYAWGSDYHDVLRQKLELMLEGMRARISGDFHARCYVDTGPVLERAFARQTAVGWMGKNTCLIQQQLGSWFFLGEILTTLDLPKDEPAADRCGSCTRCIDACPTQALIEPRVLDSTRCISYWTIEAKDEAFGEDVASGLGRHVFGCDICQDVCPWNRRAPLTSVPEFQPRAGLMNPPLEELEKLTEEEFRVLFRNSPVRRLGYRRFKRNVAAAIANAGTVIP